MNDLVQRLRQPSDFYFTDQMTAKKANALYTSLLQDGADAIEKLEAENAQLKAELAAMGEPFATMRFNENGGATFSGIPAGTVLKAGDVFTLYAAPGAMP